MRPAQSPMSRQSRLSPIEPVRSEIRSERLQRVGVSGLPHVVGDVEELDAPEAEQARAVRVSRTIGEGVVLAMNRHPLLPRLSGRQPQGDPEGQVGDRVQMEGPVRQCPVQVDRRRDDGDLGQRDGDARHDPRGAHEPALDRCRLARL